MKSSPDSLGLIEIRKEKWVKYYSSFHQILLVGDGDFSFSLCLALAFGSASNILASSLDSYDVVIEKYKNAKSNLEKLAKLGAYVLHGVDATKMKLHTDLCMRKFDRIIFNFPHAGFHGWEDDPRLIRMHKTLMHGFFKNASGMLSAYGEIHVNHKTTAPFRRWNIEGIANLNSLALTECVNFKIEDYPGYNNKRGDGPKCDESFPLGKCSTFKFSFFPTPKKTSQSGSPYGNMHQLQLIQISKPQQPPGNPNYTDMNLDSPYSNMHQLQLIQTPMPLQPARNYSFMPMNSMPGSVLTVLSPLDNSSRRSEEECHRIFSKYFNHAMVTFGSVAVEEFFRLGFERYTAQQPLNDHIQLLCLFISNLRSENLQNKVEEFLEHISRKFELFSFLNH